MADGGAGIWRFRPDDTEAVIALWERCELTRPWIDARSEIALNQRTQPDGFHVAELDGAVVGTVVAGFDGRRGWLNYLAVDPEHRGRGLGARLVHAAERHLAALGCPKVNLQVRHDNDAVVAFYERLGYVDDRVLSLGKRLPPADR